MAGAKSGTCSIAWRINTTSKFRASNCAGKSAALPVGKWPAEHNLRATSIEALLESAPTFCNVGWALVSTS